MPQKNFFRTFVGFVRYLKINFFYAPKKFFSFVRYLNFLALVIDCFDSASLNAYLSGFIPRSSLSFGLVHLVSEF